MDTQDTEWLLRALAREARTTRQACVVAAMCLVVQVFVLVMILTGTFTFEFRPIR